jgi:hypothetical protein
MCVGSIQDLQVAVNPPNPRAAAAAEHWMRQARYSPAMCADKPVAGEVEIEVQTLLPID